MGIEEIEQLTLAIESRNEGMINVNEINRADSTLHGDQIISIKCVNEQEGFANQQTIPNANYTQTLQNDTIIKDNKTRDQEVQSQSNQVCAPAPFANAARERSRVKTLRSAFLDLQRALPCVPLDTKLSKLGKVFVAYERVKPKLRNT